MPYTFIYRRLPGAIFKKLLARARRNGCTVHEQARRELVRQLAPELNRLRRKPPGRHAA